jgi:tRNA threonylcarbamoyladenosine biosynthesis protein TsaE
MENGVSRIRFSELSELENVAKELIRLSEGERIWLFEGTMGAGKTTLIKKICENIGVVSTVQSPTFSIVNEYVTKSGDGVYHFDFYRLKDEEEALDIGIEEYLDSGNYCFLEWPGKIESLWPASYFQVELTLEEAGRLATVFVVR